MKIRITGKLKKAQIGMWNVPSTGPTQTDHSFQGNAGTNNYNLRPGFGTANEIPVGTISNGMIDNSQGNLVHSNQEGQYTNFWGSNPNEASFAIQSLPQQPMYKQTVVNADATKTKSGVINNNMSKLYSLDPNSTNPNDESKQIKNPNIKPRDFMQGMTKFMTTLDVANSIGNYFDNKNKQKDWDAKFRQSTLSDNMYAVTPQNMSGNRGDYDINSGMFRPDETGFKSKGMYTNKFYNQQNFAQDGGELPEAQFGATFNTDPGFVTPDIISGNDYSSLGPVMQLGTYGPKRLTNADVKPVGSLSHIDHNNPGNIHTGSFASKYGASTGRPDVGGNIAVFPNMTTGLQAERDLLFGKNYKNLTISQAREKWVGHSGWQESAADMIRSVGGDKTLASLSPDEQEKIVSKFVKWEDGGVYKVLKQQGLLKYQLGGEQTNTMKIRITEQPDNLDNMAYGGQKGYGFDLGQRNTYSKMNQSSFQDASNIIQEVPRDQANVEAEKGETVYGDLDGDGMMEHKEIGGERHTDGGTPLNVPEGSFIFSDTKKMKIKDPEVLKQFGKSAKLGGITPADIAKQYDLTKYKAILQDPLSDKLAKKTAEMMISNYNAKLSKLAIEQEKMKGFPSGIPNVAQQHSESVKEGSEPSAIAQFGGYLKKFQGAQGSSTVSTYQPGVTDDLSQKEAAGYTIVKPGTFMKDMPGLQHQRDQKGVYGTENFTDLEHFNDFHERFPTFFETHKNWDPRQKGQTQQFQQWYTDNVDKDYFSGVPGKDPYSIDDKFGQHTWSAPMWNKTNKPIVPGTPPPTRTSTTIPSVNEFTPSKGKVPYGWTTPDKMNLLNATINLNPKKYLPYTADVNLGIPNPTFNDWRGQAGALQSNYNNAAQMHNVFSSSSAAAANLSNLAAQQAQQLAGSVIPGVNAQNVGIANQFAPMQNQIVNSESAQRAENRTNNWTKNVIANQQFDNAQKEARASWVDAFNRGHINAADLYNTNLTESPYYYYDHNSGVMKFKGPGTYSNFMNQRFGNQNANTAQGMAQAYNQHYKTTYDSLKDIPEEHRAAAADYMTKRLLGMDTETVRRTTGPMNQPKSSTYTQKTYTGQY